MSEMITIKEIETLEYVKKHKELEPYFFQKLISKKEVKWLNILKERGFLDKESIPVYKEGAYVEQWNILNYIKSIIEGIVINKDSSNLEYILDLILQVAEVSHNFRVFEQSIDILSYIPPENYEDTYLENLLRYWLNDNFEVERILYSISKNLMPILSLQDKAKSFILFKSLLKKFVELEGARNYVIESMISNDEVILNLTKHNYENIICLLIELLENKSERCSSERKISNMNFKIEKTVNKYCILIDNVKIIEQTFSGRIYDIKNIIDTVKKNYHNINEDELERNIKLLYGDLFIEEAFESIFSEKEYCFSVKDYLVFLIKKYLMLNSESIKETCTLLEKMLKNDYDLIKKIGLFIISERFTEYKNFLLDQMKNNMLIFDYIFRYYIFEDEVKHIFEKIDSIDSEYIEIINNCIEQGEYIKYDWEYEYIDIWKQKRYFALKNIPYFNEKYKELRLKTGVEAILAPAISFTGAHFIEEKSPISEEQILQMSNEELVNNMLQFREVNKFDESFTELSYRGYGDTLKKVIKLKPERFINDLHKFDKIQYEFISYILDAFKDLIKESRIDDFSKIISFINLYTKSESFWQDEYCYEKDKSHLVLHKGMLKNTFWLIVEYLQNDKYKFSTKEYSEIKTLLISCYEKANLNIKEDVLFSNNDYDFYSLNSLAGIFIRVLIEIALKIKRCNLHEISNSWETDIKPIYEKCLNDKCIDAYFLLGQFIGNLTYIDKTWVVNKIESIKHKNERWEFFVSGYLYSRTVYGDYFNLMKENLYNALGYSFADKDIKERLAEHITFAYLNGFDDTNSIFEEIISQWNTEMVKKAIRTCYSVDKKSFVKGITMEIVKSKTLMLWSSVVKRYKNMPISELTQDDVKIIREAANLLNNFTNINSNIEDNIRFSFKYLKDDFYSYSLIEYFTKLIKEKNDEINKQSTLLLISDFLLDCLPTYPEEAIKELLKHLKNNNNDETIINRIMQAYMEKSPERMNIVKYINSELLSKY